MGCTLVYTIYMLLYMVYGFIHGVWFSYAIGKKSRITDTMQLGSHKVRSFVCFFFANSMNAVIVIGNPILIKSTYLLILCRSISDHFWYGVDGLI